jgi:hypothetical protein
MYILLPVLPYYLSSPNPECQDFHHCTSCSSEKKSGFTLIISPEKNADIHSIISTVYTLLLYCSRFLVKSPFFWTFQLGHIISRRSNTYSVYSVQSRTVCTSFGGFPTYESVLKHCTMIIADATQGAEFSHGLHTKKRLFGPPHPCRPRTAQTSLPRRRTGGQSEYKLRSNCIQSMILCISGTKKASTKKWRIGSPQ